MFMQFINLEDCFPEFLINLSHRYSMFSGSYVTRYFTVPYLFFSRQPICSSLVVQTTWSGENEKPFGRGITNNHVEGLITQVFGQV